MLCLEHHQHSNNDRWYYRYFTGKEKTNWSADRCRELPDIGQVAEQKQPDPAAFASAVLQGNPLVVSQSLLNRASPSDSLATQLRAFQVLWLLKNFQSLRNRAYALAWRLSNLYFIFWGRILCFQEAVNPLSIGKWSEMLTSPCQQKQYPGRSLWTT